MEFLLKIADVKLGLALGFFETKDRKHFDEFLDDMRPTAFRINNGLIGESEELCDKYIDALIKEIHLVGNQYSEKKKVTSLYFGGGTPALAADRINSKGYHPAVLTDESACIGCAFCATMCPDSAITVEK